MDDLERLERWVKRRMEKNPCELPTVREAARSLGMRQSKVVELAETFEHGTLNVAFGIPGVGYADIDSQGDWSLEVWE